MIKKSDILNDVEERLKDLPDDSISVQSLVVVQEDDVFLRKPRDLKKNAMIYGSMYSVDSVLLNAPELMNEKLIIRNHDKIREAEPIEKELSELSQIKSAYDSLPRVTPESDDDVVPQTE